MGFLQRDFCKPVLLCPVGLDGVRLQLLPEQDQSFVEEWECPTDKGVVRLLDLMAVCNEARRKHHLPDLYKLIYERLTIWLANGVKEVVIWINVGDAL